MREAHAQEATLKSQEQMAQATERATEMQLKLKQLEFNLQERAELRKEAREAAQQKRDQQIELDKEQRARVESINAAISKYSQGDAESAA